MNETVFLSRLLQSTTFKVVHGRRI